jgi:hypothetical protein
LVIVTSISHKQSAYDWYSFYNPSPIN